MRRWRNGPTPGGRPRGPRPAAAPEAAEEGPNLPVPAGLPDDDAAVVRRVLDGCKDDFAVLVARYRQPLYRYVAGKSHDRAAADDLVQRAFVTAYELLAGYDPRRPLLDWLRGIARNHCRNEWRRLARQARLTGQAMEARRAELEAADAAPDDDRLPALRACLEMLPEDERRLVAMRFAEQLPLRAIGERVGRTDEAVRQLLYRVRVRLAACVRRRLGLDGGELE